MELLLIRHSFIARRLRQKQRIMRVEQIKQMFDDIVSFLNNTTSVRMKNDALHILTTICEELATLNTFKLFDHLILRNHQILIYIGHTCEMLLTKSNHSQSIPMTKQEDDCFYATSYLIAQLCLHQNEPVELFYGNVSSEIFPVTEKPNLRAQNIDENSNRRDELTGPPNLKTARLPPSAPEARPIEQKEPDITKVMRLKKFPSQFVSVSNESETEYLTPQCHQIKILPKKFQGVFLTESFVNKLVRAIDDLSRNEYPAYHVKYKVVDRFVRLYSKLNIVDVLLDPILKCLQSKYYRDALETIEINQIRFNPKQLFFIHECSQFIFQHDFLQQEKVVRSLSKQLIEVTKSIFDKHFLATDVEIESNEGGDRRLAIHALSCHIEFLYHLSLTSIGRQYFLQSLVVDQLLLLLRQSALIQSVKHKEYLFNADINLIAHSLMLLCNLSYEKQIFLLLKKTDLNGIYSELQSAKDYMIQFASSMLIKILSQQEIDENHEPAKLKEAYIKFLESVAIESKQEITTGVARHIIEREIDINYKITGSFLEKLIQDIEHLSTHESDAKKYNDVGRRVRICSKQETEEVQTLLDPIITCLTSIFYVNVYMKIDRAEAKIASGVMRTSYSLAANLFFMRDCPEFVMRHDYKRQDEIASLLCQKMLEITDAIFEKHLSIAIGNQGQISLFLAEEDDDERNNDRIEALSYHIKLLNHFALAPSFRKGFLATPVIDQILLILQDETLVDATGRIIDAKIGIVGQSLTLLYNLAFDTQILSIIKNKNILEICSKLRLVQDKIIQFASQTLIAMCAPDIIEDISETSFLSKIYIEYMGKSVKEPRRPRHGVRLDGVLKIFEVIIGNDSVQENIVNEREGIPSIIQCALVECPDNVLPDMFKRIRRSAFEIIWKLLSSLSGPRASGKLKSNDLFIDNLLTLSNETSKKQKKISDRIMWKLGDEYIFRSEQMEKEKQREDKRRRGSTTITTDDHLITNDEWDDSVPFDLMISYSNHLNDRILCHRICSRLRGKNFKVYIEKPGKHRLELIQKAVAEDKIILVCLSNKYRASNLCMAEVEHASKHKCPIISVLVEANYKAKGWLNHLVGGDVVIDFTKKNFDDELLKLIDKIDQIKASK